MKEKEVSLNDEIHRLRRERDGKDAALVALQKDLEETREKLQAADFDVQSYREETKRLERENVDAEKKLKKAQQVVDEESSFSSELADLKEQLAQNTDALHCKERDLTTLRKDYSGLKSKVAHREDEKSQLQMQLTESHSAIERLRKESDARVEKHQKDTAALLEARNHVESLQKEKRGLESSLERSRLSESKMNDAQAKFLVEREGYQTEIAELQAAIEAKEREMGRVQAEAAEKLERAAESHRLEVRELRHRLRESENALKETETNLRRSEIEHNRQVEEVKKGFRKKFDQLVQAKVTRSQEQSGQSILPGKPRNPQPFPTVSSTSVDTLHNVQEDNPRKKVSRQNNSVLGSSSASHTLQGPVPDSATALNAWSNHREEGPLSLDLIDPALRDDLGARGSLDEHGVSVVGPAPAVVPETQESLTHSFDLFNLDTNQASGKDKSSNSILSDIPSEELDTFETEHWPIPAPVGAVRRERPLREELPVHGRNMETPIRASNVLYPDSQYSGSQDRPKSQANTASRIMPPPQQFPSPGHGTSGRVTNSTESRPRLSQRSGRTSANATSSPDYVHQPALGSMTYSLRSGRNAMPAVLQRDGTPKIPEQPSSYKRKSSANYDNESPSSKRYRSSSQSLLPSVPKVYQAQAAGVSDAPSRLRGHRRTPDPAEGSQGPMSYPRRSSVGGPARKSPARSSQGARGQLSLVLGCGSIVLTEAY
ncbi:hypothetical protein BU26DRAFT_298116 [Trematosphaeria pertusa]|uniref:Uncharacterized protein n=1 Tax=Trematosphaeria pertusa TaxID=390896 RepID=A0A6A6IJL9_9PLEO|nr:uncharacterized protein BU26DRAFT_298116 [Trematosphaeria pertusa]KAF2250258.1 hypothetical protein BU26DRAFT_298116 [Trematosphaeria pertusa]